MKEPPSKSDGWKCDCGYAPVAPVRKWDPKEAIGWLGEDPIFVTDCLPEVQAALSGGGDERWEKEAPVAPVRKWEAGEVVGERRCANPDCDTTLHVFMHNLSPEVQDALNGRKA